MAVRNLQLFIGALILLAQPVMATPVNEEQLGKLLSFYAPIQELKVDFQQIKHLKDMGVDLKSQGHLQIKRPDQVKWEIEKPAHMLVEIDKDKVQLTEAGGAPQVFELKKMSKDNAARGIGMLVPWLVLDVKTLSAQYAIDSVDARHFVFEPRGEQKMFKSMDVALAKGGHMEKLVLHESSGDSLEILFGRPQVLQREAKAK